MHRRRVLHVCVRPLSLMLRQRLLRRMLTPRTPLLRPRAGCVASVWCGVARSCMGARWAWRAENRWSRAAHRTHTSRTPRPACRGPCLRPCGDTLCCVCLLVLATVVLAQGGARGGGRQRRALHARHLESLPKDFARQGLRPRQRRRACVASGGDDRAPPAASPSLCLPSYVARCST